MIRTLRGQLRRSTLSRIQCPRHPPALRRRTRTSLLSRRSSAIPSSPTLPGWYFHHKRSLSTTTEESTLEGFEREPMEDEIDHLERLTHFIVSSAPLGTMSERVIQRAIQAVDQWCQLDPSVGYALDSANRILHRLHVELATGSRPAKMILDYGTLSQIHDSLCRSWLAMGMKIETALDRAEDHLVRLVDWYDAGYTTLLPLELVESLVLARLDHGTVESLRGACNVLLWWTESEVSLAHETVLSPLFHRALSLNIERSDREAARTLMDRMQLLVTQRGWKTLTVSDDIIAEALQLQSQSTLDIRHEEQRPSGELSTSTTTLAADTGKLSDFEIQALENNFRKVLTTASEKDRSNVEKLVQQLESAIIPPQKVSRELAGALVEYYVRIEDAKEATTWLRRVDSDNDNLVSAAIHRSVLSLWTSLSDSDAAAPWRAQEIFDRMKQVDLVSTDIYNGVMKCWSVCGDAVARSKIKDLYESMLQSRKRGEMDKAPDIESCSIILASVPLDAKHANSVLSIVLELWATLEKPEKEQFLDVVSEMMGKIGISKEGSELLQQAQTEGLVVPARANKIVVEALAQTGDYPSLMNSLEGLEVTGGIRVEYYKIALLALMDGPKHYRSRAAEKALVDKALTLCLDEKRASIDDYEQARDIMKTILWKMKWQRRPGDAEHMLRYIEGKTLGSSHAFNPGLYPPISCFIHVIESCAKHGKTNLIRDTLDRLLKHYRKGHTELLPNKAIFDMYLTSMAKSKSDAYGAKESQRVLDEMIDLFESSGQEDCKPDQRIFNLVLMAWYDHANEHGHGEQAVDASYMLLDRMKDVGIMPDVFAMNTVMHTVLQAKVEDGYTRVARLSDQVDELGLEPTPFTCTLLLRACSRARQSEVADALKRSLNAMNKLKEMEQAKATDFLVFAMTMRNIMPRNDRRREKLIRSTYYLCHTQKGPLSYRIEKRFRWLLGMSPLSSDRKSAST